MTPLDCPTSKIGEWVSAVRNYLLRGLSYATLTLGCNANVQNFFKIGA